MDDLEDLIEKYTDVDWKTAKLLLPTMGTEELLELMADLGPYANRSLALEIAKRSDALFWLGKRLQEESYWYEGDGWAPVHAIYILPLVGGSEALDLMLDILRYRYYGMLRGSTEDVSAILYAFGKDAIDAFRDFTEDETIKPLVRLGVVRSLTAFAREGMRYDEIRDHLVRLLENTRDGMFAAVAADSLAKLRDPTVWPAIHRAFEEGRIEEESISEDYLREIVDGVHEDILKRELESCTRSPLDLFSREEVEKWSRISRMEKRIEGEKKGKKVGRNDLCPCGSGRKFKKCCMGKGIYD